MNYLYSPAIFPLSQSVIYLAERFSDLEPHEMNERIIGYILLKTTHLVDRESLVESLCIDLPDTPLAASFDRDLERAIGAVTAQLEMGCWDPYDMCDTAAMGLTPYSYTPVSCHAYSLIRHSELNNMLSMEAAYASMATPNGVYISRRIPSVFDGTEHDKEELLEEPIRQLIQGADPKALTLIDPGLLSGYMVLHRDLLPLRLISQALPSAQIAVYVINEMYYKAIIYNMPEAS